MAPRAAVQQNRTKLSGGCRQFLTQMGLLN